MTWQLSAILAGHTGDVCRCSLTLEMKVKSMSVRTEVNLFVLYVGQSRMCPNRRLDRFSISRQVCQDVEETIQ